MHRNRRRSKTPHSTETLESRLLLATFRSIDGTGNNQRPGRTDQGAADTNLIRFGYPGDYPDDFGDEILEAPERANPRDISNAIVAQSESIPNDRDLSDWIVQWGQFVTHDMDLTGTGAANNQLSTGATGDFSVPVTDQNDPLGPNPITFNRSNFDPSTGDNTQIGGNPPRRNWREQINEITSYIDASQVYGSDDTRANNLRTFTDGKLETSSNGLLPGLNDAQEENDNPLGLAETSLFLAGDVRANEQIGLTATHALFVREHNRLADLIKTQNPSFTDEEIYQWARKIVGAQMQIITYEEFLPALMGSAAPDPAAYTYSNQVDASITNSFAAAFFRYGHSMQSSTMKLVDNDGNVVDDLSLRDIFFNAAALVDDPTIVDVALKGLAVQTAQENDIQLVDDVRNFLFGPPGAGGTDLAALDIQRGRDHGLQDFNSSRRSYGLTRYTNFGQITSDAQLSADLQTLYGNINNIDAWVGALAEDHVAGSSIGTMLQASFTDQFTRLRDGDRFFYTGDADLSDSVVTGVIDLNAVTLASIIRSNTSITNIHDNVFFAAPGFHVEAADVVEVTEGGATESVSVVLLSAPSSNVVVSVVSDTPSEASVSASTLTFTPSNWHIAQLVSVSGVSDNSVDGDQSSTITFSVNDVSSDDSFDDLPDVSVSVTTIDSDAASVSLSIAAASISESGSTTGTVTRNTDTTEALTVTLSLTSNDTDEATFPATVTIAAGQASSDPFTIAGVDDHFVDGTETVMISASATSHASGSDSVEVTDDNVAALVLDISSASISESGSTTGTVTRNTDSTEALTVTLALVGNDTDEVAFPTIVTIAAGQVTSDPFTVSGVDDQFVDGTQAVTIFATATGHADGSDSVDVTDENTAAVVLEIDAVSISEGGSTTAMVTRNTDTTEALTVTLSLATNDTDEATFPATVTIAAGQTTSAPFTVSGVDDQIVDGTQVVTISATATGHATGSDNVDVADVHVAALVLDISSASISESGSTTGTVTRNTDTTEALTVTLSLASNDTDEATFPTTVIIAAGQVTSDPFTVSGIDDQFVDGTQTVTISGGAAGHTEGRDSVNVTDDNVAALILDVSAASINESGSTTGTITRNTDTTEALTVTLSLASNDTDEATFPATVTIAAGQTTSDPFTVSGVDDQFVDGTQTVMISATATNHADGSDSVDVTDDNVASLFLDIAAVSISENGSTTGTVTRNTDTTEALTVTLSLTSNDSDEATFPTTVTISAGQATSEPFTIAGVDDQTTDGAQTVVVAAIAGEHVNGSDNLVVTDDNVATVVLDITAASISESGSTTGIVTRNTDTTESLTVTLSLASNDADEVTFPTTVTIAVGQATSDPFTISGVDDHFVDGTQTVTISATAIDHADDSDSVDVTDENVASLVLDISSASISEGGSTTGTVTRNTDTIESLTVTLASNDTDEVTFPSTVTIGAGQTTSDPFTISGVADQIVDGTQTVTISTTANGHANGSSSVDVTDDNETEAGDVDDDNDFDANDAFLIQLVMLAGSNAQIEQSKGSSPLTGAEIRQAVGAIQLDGDVDGDADFDANDAFLIQLVKLAGSNAQIEQSKGASSLTASQIRTNVDDLGSNQQSSISEPVATVPNAEGRVWYSNPEVRKTNLFEPDRFGAWIDQL